MSIRRISLYGFLTLILGSFLSAVVLLYFLFHLDTIRAEQQITENSYDALFEFKYYTERLLTTYDLYAEIRLWSASQKEFEKHLRALKRVRGEQSVEFNSLWGVIQSEIVKIKEALEDPLFQAKNTMEKSLLRRLGEGWNTNEQSDYYIALSRLYNRIEYLKQYEGFLLDELKELRVHHTVEARQRMETTKWYAIVFPLVILFLTLLFAFVISTLIGRNEHALIEAQDDLQLSLDEFEHLFDTTLESIFLVEEGACIDANAKAIEMFGLESKEAIVGKTLTELIVPEGREHVGQMMRLDQSEPFETEALTRDGHRFPVLFHGHYFMSRGHKIRIAAMLDLTDLQEKDRALQQTVRELQENEAQLMRQQRILDHMAHHDLLTELPNRAYFLERLHEVTTRTRDSGEQTAIFFIDLDRFKEINDSLGHTLGDRVLEVVADRLRLSIRDEATIARIGGDEFTLLIEGASSMERLGEIARKVIDLLQEPMYVEGHELYVTSSIGISIYPDDGDSEIMLLSNADAAMYRAKAEGRNTYRFYTDDMTSEAYERVMMERNLRRALEHGDFELYYQPQVNGGSGEVVGVEALIRWPQEDGGMIPPDRFIPLAEETGRIVPLGAWILEAACTDMVRWKERGLPVGRMAINLSGKQLQQDDLYDVVVAVLEKTRCRPEWIELEVTEGFVMKDLSRSIAIMKRLRDLGIEMAIDDFGTGYSSMAYLKKLPIDTLKIDQSFIRELPENSEDAAIVRTIIALARGLNLKLIAEGVETEAQQRFLLAEGCLHHQGYYYARPLPLSEAEKLL